MSTHKIVRCGILLVTSVICWILVFGMIVSAHCATLEVSWNANAESDLAGYKVYYGVVNSAFGSPVDVGKVTSYQFTVTPTVGTTYHVAVSAYDTSGNESAKSEEVTVFVPDTTPPAQPKGLMQRLIAWLKSLFNIA